MEEFSAFNAAWQAWFEDQSITPLTILYEDLSRSPQMVLETILTALGLDGSLAHGVPAQTAKLADDTSRAWHARFQADAARPNT